MPYAEVSGLQIAFERAGEGPPLALLHGIGSNARAWRYQLSELADEFTVVAWDAPGYGRSSDPPLGVEMADYADYLAGLFDHLGLGRAHVLGLSWGGVLAQEFYRRHPSRVSSLILADTFAGGRSRPEAVRQQNLAMRLRHVESMSPAEMAHERAPALLSPQAPPELVREVESITAEIHPDGYRLAAIASSNADERDVLPLIRVPTLVLWGEYDRVTPLSESEQLRDAIPEAKLVIIPDAGHVSNQEQPARFNGAVRDFLRRQMAAEALGTAKGI